MLDFKSALPAGKGANKELAKDLAQFAIDGRAHIGVDDNDKSVPPKLTQVGLDGLKERVDQVAWSTPDPPIHVRTDAIPAAGDRGRATCSSRSRRRRMSRGRSTVSTDEGTHPLQAARHPVP